LIDHYHAWAEGIITTYQDLSRHIAPGWLSPSGAAGIRIGLIRPDTMTEGTNFYYVDEAGNPVGPLSLDEIRRIAVAGVVPPTRGGG